MGIAWSSLLLAGVMSLATGVAVVVLVSFALVGLSARAPAARVGGPEDGAPSPLNPSLGTAVAAVCLTAVVAIVGYGLSVIAA